FSLSNDKVTDTALSDQYLCISAARWAFSKIVTSRSERFAADLIGNPTTTVPSVSSLAGSNPYPAMRNISTTGSSQRSRIRRRKYRPPGDQWTPGLTPARIDAVPDGLTVVVLIDSRTHSHSE